MYIYIYVCVYICIYIYIPKSCNLQLMDSLYFFLQIASKTFYHKVTPAVKKKEISNKLNF